MDFDTKLIIVAVLAVVLIGVGGVFLAVNYHYRWTLACATENGIRMESASGSAVCVKQPVQLITIAAKPW